MSEYIDTIHDETRIICDLSRRLRRLSEAFYATGNFHIADQLEMMAADAASAQKRINDAMSIEINRGLAEARRNAGETLGLVLGNTLVDEEDK